jgi:F420-dependent oxidoreductase-like protein
VDVSLCLDTRRPWPELRDLAVAADDRGLHAVYVADHFLPVADDGPVLECWTTLTAIAGVTSTVRVGTLVLGNTYRHPAVVANMAATLDHVSAGRVVLGIGAGWQENEHTAYGIDLPAPRERLDRLEESCRALTGLLRRERTTVAGQHVRLTDAPCRPAPVQGRLPLLVGGAGERRTLRIAATYADVWHAWTPADDLPRKSAVLDRHCLAVGRDPSTIRRAGGRVLLGEPEPAAVLAEHEQAGLDEFVVRDHHEARADEILATLPG